MIITPMYSPKRGRYQGPTYTGEKEKERVVGAMFTALNVDGYFPLDYTGESLIISNDSQRYRRVASAIRTKGRVSQRAAVIKSSTGCSGFSSADADPESVS